jgi:hypothetical protein
MSEKQLSRVAGVPRLKLPIWKAAAASFFKGKDPSREEQQNSGKKTKVALLRELAAADPEVRSWLIKFATDLRARDARHVAAEQGLVMPEKLGFVSLFPGDRPEFSVMTRRVVCLGLPNSAELLEKLATLYPDGDPPDVAERQNREWAVVMAEIEKRQTRPGYTCDWCAGPWTRIINGTHYCDRHDGKPTSQSPAVPATLSNSAVPASATVAVPDPTGRIAALQALREVHEYEACIPRRGGATYGPTDPTVPKISVL